MVDDDQRRVGAAKGHLRDALSILVDEESATVTVFLMLDGRQGPLCIGKCHGRSLSGGYHRLSHRHSHEFSTLYVSTVSGQMPRLSAALPRPSFAMGEVQNGPRHEGELRAAWTNCEGAEPSHQVLSLRLPDGKCERVIPDLYEPAIVNNVHGVMVLRGFERVGEGDDAVGVVQEWRCEVIGQ
jgi:hypothetical protein